MEKRKWSSQQKLQIVLEGLSGQIEISKLCAKYQIGIKQIFTTWSNPKGNSDTERVATYH